MLSMLGCSQTHRGLHHNQATIVNYNTSVAISLCNYVIFGVVYLQYRPQVDRDSSQLPDVENEMPEIAESVGQGVLCCLCHGLTSL